MIHINFNEDSSEVLTTKTRRTAKVIPVNLKNSGSCPPRLASICSNDFSRSSVLKRERA
ncbi:hypothetical protein [Laspinema olomoucense]|uniref:hypothetical protein n=1 Tax=Laspinema olomoucense TaxID=3231600 RepID=UPI0021BB1F8B|nr:MULTISPECIES: hypothetical protein [unclassified Laspinema]MCT7970990.1 hypothetical protein [Laspinema sp. D3d]MCT7989940.1 hypothetical protein [Laspinema sp. D3a]MCT7995695.1 hypothetical protein [Laspinema sp. D3c]